MSHQSISQERSHDVSEESVDGQAQADAAAAPLPSIELRTRLMRDATLTTLQHDVTNDEENEEWLYEPYRSLAKAKREARQASQSTTASATSSSSTASSSNPTAKMKGKKNKKASAPFDLYLDAIHSILSFLSLNELLCICRLSREWRAGVASFKGICGSKLPPRQDDVIWLTSEKWLEIRKYPTAPLLRHMTSLHLCAAHVTANELSNLFPSLTYLELYGPYGPEGVDIIRECKNLTELFVEFKGEDDEGASTLAEAIKQHASLVSVHIRGEQIGEPCLSSIVDAASCEKVTECSFISEDDEFDLAIVADAIKHNTRLKALTLRGFEFFEADSIATVMKHESLTRLDLDSNYFIEDDLFVIADSLKQNNNLTHFSLSENNFSDEETQAFADALKQNNTLTTLQLDKCGISDMGGVAIADAIRHNTSLTDLSMLENLVQKGGMTSIAESVNHNHRITVDLRGNALPHADATSITASCDVASFDLSLDIPRPSNSSVRLFIPSGVDHSVRDFKAVVEASTRKMKANGLQEANEALPEDPDSGDSDS